MVAAVFAALLATGGFGASSALADTTSTAGVAAVGSRLINGDGDTSGKCLEISGSGTTHRIQMGTCHVNAHAGWSFPPVEGGWFEIRSHDGDSSGRCLTGFLQGSQAEMVPCDGLTDQHWTRVWAANDWFLLKNRFHSNLCLDVQGGGTTNIVQSWPCGNPANAGPQKWHWHSV